MPTNLHPGYRLFVIGAGFSVPAGLPLGNELFAEVKNQIEIQYGTNTKFHNDLNEFLEYKFNKPNGSIHGLNIDLEEFMSFLDIDHFLGLRGSKAWNDEGNESQLMIRKALGQVIHNRTPAADKLPDIYYQFAEKLSLNDTIITLNYDIILERALEHIGKPYRLFPRRYKSINDGFYETDNEIKEVTILKIHGSVDWFHNKSYLDLVTSLKKNHPNYNYEDNIFDERNLYETSPIVSGLRSQDDPLLHIHRIRKVDDYYKSDTSFTSPFILSPSHVKFVYSKPLLDFWHGLGRSGGYNLGVSIIGFSMPKHDDYIRIALFKIISNYQQSWWDDKIIDQIKDYVKLVDFRIANKSIKEYKLNYNFVDFEKAKLYFSGFNKESIKFLFETLRIE